MINQQKLHRNNFFLERFQGKHTAVKRDGLLQILDRKTPSINKPPPQQHPPNRKSNKVIKKQQPTKKADNPEQLRSFQPSCHTLTRVNLHKSHELKVSLADKTSKKHSRRSLEPRVEGRKQAQKLPKKIKQTISKSDIKLPRVKTTLKVVREPLIGPRPPATEPKLTTKDSNFTLNSSSVKDMKLDPYALKHLQFLNKFEQSLLMSRMAHGSKN